MFKKVKDRQVRKFNNLLNKKEGNITLQSSQVTPATRASPQVVNRQAIPATRATASSQEGRQATQATKASPQVALNSQEGSQVSTRAPPSGSRQAGFPSRQHFSPGREHSLPGLPGKQHSSPSREWGLPGRYTPGNPSSEVLSQTKGSACFPKQQFSGRQFPGRQYPLADSTICQLDSEASQLGSSQASVPRLLAVLVCRKQGLSPFLIGITVPRVLPPGRNLTQSGSSTYLANL